VCAVLLGYRVIHQLAVGRPLIALNAERYAREAELRHALMHVNEKIEGITIYGAENAEKQILDRVFDIVLGVSRRIVGALTRLTWVTAGYGEPTTGW
jgi:vitamin B12/bleomycin/antimicrobial peptide transport system ATP-binding/permease protein